MPKGLIKEQTTKRLGCFVSQNRVEVKSPKFSSQLVTYNVI